MNEKTYRMTMRISRSEYDKVKARAKAIGTSVTTLVKKGAAKACTPEPNPILPPAIHPEPIMALRFRLPANARKMVRDYSRLHDISLSELFRRGLYRELECPTDLHNFTAKDIKPSTFWANHES